MPAKRPKKQESLLTKFDLEFMARTYAARTAKDLTQEQAGKELGGFTQDHYKQFEIRGKMPHEMIPKFLQMTGVSYEYLFTGQDRGPAWHERYHQLLRKLEQPQKPKRAA